LVKAEFLAFYFTSFIRHPLREQELAQFERAVAAEAKRHNQLGGTRVELIAHGSNSVQEEMSRGVMDAAKAKLIGLFMCPYNN
jgi:adenosine deaminase